MNHPTQCVRITILRFVLVGLVLLFSGAALFADGIASRYPGDVGIENDPEVILADGFETYTDPSQLPTIGPWDHAGPLARLRIATESGDFFAGKKALEMDLNISSTEQADAIVKYPVPEEKVLFVRAYEKFDLGFNAGNGHNGLRFSGKGTQNPDSPCIKALENGTGKFVFILQNGFLHKGGENEPGYAHIYSYWPFQKSGCGDHWYPDGEVDYGWGLWILYPFQYPHFVAMPNWQPLRGVWYCYEFMVKSTILGSAMAKWPFGLTASLKDAGPICLFAQWIR
jgi:hypothetical protein